MVAAQNPRILLVMNDLETQFREWEKDTPADLFGDPIWRMTAYRIALFLSEVVAEDAATLRRRFTSHDLVSQLERSVGSIKANISEGYGYVSGKKRALYYETALSSAREARDWYRDTRVALGDVAATERGALLTRVMKILTVAIPQERAGASERRIEAARKRRESASRKEAGPRSIVPSPSPSSSTQE